MSTTLSIQADFTNYFGMIQTDATTSVFYTDIKKQFEEGKIDAGTYATIITSFHQNTLQQGLSIAKELSLGIRELELKTNESIAKVALTERQTEAIGEELFIKGADSASNRAVNDARIVEFNREYTLNQARSNREINESSKRIALDEARRQLVLRQKSGYEDNLRIKKAEHSSGLYGMIESGGNESPQDLVNLVMSSLNNI